MSDFDYICPTPEQQNKIDSFREKYVELSVMILNQTQSINYATAYSLLLNSYNNACQGVVSGE